MLLEHDLLAEACARVWRHRETIEYEAAQQFADHASLLRTTGAPSVVADMAAAAADDEIDHAHRCRAIVDRLHRGLPEADTPREIHLGPRTLSPRRRALYASVALSCVTETLSSALLLAMSKVARDALVAETVHKILTDEIDHSRLGWAHLAHEAQRGDVSWLAPHVAGMIADALRSDIAPMTLGRPMEESPHYGVLLADQVAGVTRETVREVIVPGLARFGVAVRLPVAHQAL